MPPTEMSAQADEVVFLGQVEELPIEILGREAEDDVHARSAADLDGAPEEARVGVHHRIKLGGFCAVALFDTRKSPLIAQPLEHVSHKVDPEGRGGIE